MTPISGTERSQSTETLQSRQTTSSLTQSIQSAANRQLKRMSGHRRMPSLSGIEFTVPSDISPTLDGAVKRTLSSEERERQQQALCLEEPSQIEPTS